MQQHLTTIDWVFIPGNWSLGIVEQWQARATYSRGSMAPIGPRTVAALVRNPSRLSQWQATIQGPGGEIAVLQFDCVASGSLIAARSEVEGTLRDMGWK